MANQIVSAFLFLQHGKKYPESMKSELKNTKKIVNNVTVFGYVNYLDNGHGYLNYMGRDEAEDDSVDKFKRYPTTFTSAGSFEKKEDGTYDEKYQELLKQMSKDFEPNDLIWIPIVSLEGYDFAQKMHMYSDQDYKVVLAEALPKWFRSVGLDPDNMHWIANYHNNTRHPHVHFMFMEKVKTRMKGTFTKHETNSFRDYIGAAMAKRARILEEAKQTVNTFDADKRKIILELHKDMDQKYRHVTSSVSNFLIQNEDIGFQKDLADLYYKMDLILEGKGSMKYNSKNILPVKKDINDIIDKALNHPINIENYELLKQKWITLDEYTKGQFSDHPDYYFVKGDAKLRTRIGNLIIQNKEDYQKWYGLNPNEVKKNSDEKVERYKNSRMYSCEQNKEGQVIFSFKDTQLKDIFSSAIEKVNDDRFIISYIKKENEVVFRYNPSIEKNYQDKFTKTTHFTMKLLKDYLSCSINHLQDGTKNTLEVEDHILETLKRSDSTNEIQKKLIRAIKKNNKQPDNYYYSPISKRESYKSFTSFNQKRNADFQSSYPGNRHRSSSSYIINNVSNMLIVAHNNFGEDVQRALQEHQEEQEYLKQQEKIQEEFMYVS